MQATDRPEPGRRALGDELRSLRRSRGLAQRDLLRPLHLGSHSAIVDFEAGRRIPPAAVITAYEQFFGLASGSLSSLRDQALAERAAVEGRARSGGPQAAGGGGPVAAVPRQLPAAPEIFTGRIAELAQLDRLLRDRETGTPVVISAVSGMGGIGKTALAVHWAHQARDNFADGELYIDMQGYHPTGQPVAPESALGQFLVALGVAAERIPVALSEQAGLYRTLMAGRRTLVLLDNVRDVEQVRPLLPGTPLCKVLITSRSRLPGLVVREGAQRIALDTLELRDAVRLLRRLIGARAADQPGATAALASLCGLHPLALRIAAERVVLDDRAVADAVAQLSQPGGRLAGLAVPDDDAAAIRNVFAWSYQGLQEPQRRLFRLLGLHDGPNITARAGAALAGLSEPDCERLLGSLADAHLLEVVEPGRYRLHDLLQLFAHECVLAEEPTAERDQAAFRLAAWYLRSACAARTVLDPNLPPLAPVEAELEVEPSVPPLEFGTEEAALAWCETERANLTATALSASRAGLHEIGWKLPTALFPFFDRRKHYGDWISTHRAAISCAHQAGDREAEGKVRCNLGNCFWPTRRFEEAAQEYEAALTLFREVGWQQGEAKVLGNLGNLRHEAGDYPASITWNMAAVTLFRQLGDRYGEALCLSNLGGTYSALGDQDRALASADQALAAFEALGDRRGAARCHATRGNALARSDHLAQAGPELMTALRAFEEAGDLHMQANVLADLAEVHSWLGLDEQARRFGRRAADIWVAIGEDWQIAIFRERLPGLDVPGADVGAASGHPSTTAATS
jgi:tetratricopeptide (TPR) repeat protein/transcriptional regulator with XRE-family HTH domain